MRRPSKRLLFRLAILAAVVALGIVGILQAQRMIWQSADDDQTATAGEAAGGPPREVQALPDTDPPAESNSRHDPFGASRFVSPADRSPSSGGAIRMVANEQHEEALDRGNPPLAPAGNLGIAGPTLSGEARLADRFEKTELDEDRYDYPAAPRNRLREPGNAGLDDGFDDQAAAPAELAPPSRFSQPGGMPISSAGTSRFSQELAPPAGWQNEDELDVDEAEEGDVATPPWAASLGAGMAEEPLGVSGSGTTSPFTRSSSPGAGGLAPRSPLIGDAAAPNPRYEPRGGADLGSALPSSAAGTAAGTPGDQRLEGPQTPSLVLEKLAPAEIQVGKEAQFTITVRNVGRATAERVVVRDYVPQGTRLVDTQPAARLESDGAVVWEIGSLGPDQTKTVAMQLMPLSEGEVGSVATVSFQAQASVRTVATRPELVLEHSLPPRVHVGEDVLLSIVISNPGTGAATGVVLQEDVPDGLSHPAGKELEFEVGTLKPGESRQLQLVLKAEKAGHVRNVIVAQGEGNLYAEHSAALEVIAPRLAVAVEGPRLRYLERKATYTVVVSNPGTAPAKDVELIAFLPKGLRFVETNNAGQYDAQQHAVLWSLEELPPGQAGQCILAAMPIETGEQKLRVEGRARMGLSAQFEQLVLIEGLASISFEVADAADPIEVGHETTYEIRVVNEGSKAANNVVVMALLPAEMRPLAAEGASRGTVSGQQVAFEPLPRLAPKADAQFRIRVQGIVPGDHRIRVQVASDEMQLPITKEEGTRVYSDQ